MNELPRYVKVVGLYDTVEQKYVPIAGETPTQIDADVSAANIKYGVDVLGILGTFTKVTSNAAAAANIANGKIAFVNGSQLVGTYGGVNLAAGNIKHGVELLGVTGTFTTEAVAPAGATHILLGKKAYVNGALVTGSMNLSNLIAANIKHNLVINGVTGAYDTEAVKPITASVVQKDYIGFVNGQKVTGTLDLALLVPENIKSGVTINGVLGTYTGA